jgi:hypothetical protein
MPFTTVLVVIGIVAVFAVFGIVLAWGDHQTRNLSRTHETAKETAPVDLKKAA